MANAPTIIEMDREIESLLKQQLSSKQFQELRNLKIKRERAIIHNKKGGIWRRKQTIKLKDKKIKGQERKKIREMVKTPPSIYKKIDISEFGKKADKRFKSKLSIKINDRFGEYKINPQNFVNKKNISIFALKKLKSKIDRHAKTEKNRKKKKMLKLLSQKAQANQNILQGEDPGARGSAALLAFIDTKGDTIHIIY